MAGLVVQGREVLERIYCTGSVQTYRGLSDLLSCHAARHHAGPVRSIRGRPSIPGFNHGSQRRGRIRVISRSRPRTKIDKVAENVSRTVGMLTHSPNRAAKRVLLVVGYAGAALFVFFFGASAWFIRRLSTASIMRGKPPPDNAFEVLIRPDN